MKRNYLIILGLLIFTVLLSLIVITISSYEKYKVKTSTNELMPVIKSNIHYVEYADLNITDIIVDVRNNSNFFSSSIENSINIPLSKILDDEFEEVFNASSRKILLCTNSVNANVAWMILTQYGVKNIYVLKGGENSVLTLSDSIKNIFNDEKAKFNYSEFINNIDTTSISNDKEIKINLPASNSNKKKSVQGGCS